MRDTEVRYGVPDMTVARSMVHLTTLSLTANGDVFYTVAQPRLVWRRNKAGRTGEFEFQSLGTDQWYPQEQLGTPATRVVVLHNTLLHGTLADFTGAD